MKELILNEVLFPQIHSYEPLPKGANSPVTTRQWTEEERNRILALKPPTPFVSGYKVNTLAANQSERNRRKKER
jgi:hypothetical protein